MSDTDRDAAPAPSAAGDELYAAFLRGFLPDIAPTSLVGLTLRHAWDAALEVYGAARPAAAPREGGPDGKFHEAGCRMLDDWPYAPSGGLCSCAAAPREGFESAWESVARELATLPSISLVMAEVAARAMWNAAAREAARGEG